MPAPTIRFVLNGRIVETAVTDPTRTVLQFLREDLRLTGTKEGCAEGDCGACTVVIAEVDRSGSGANFRSINSCIQFLPTIDGKELITVEGLRGKDGSLHPVQQAMVDNHGSQCGFCTPGFVMSLFALYHENRTPGRREIDDALAGNLCRCTGYRPIIAAARSMHGYDGGDTASVHPDLLRDVARDGDLAIELDGRRYFAPADMRSFARHCEQYPDATILAGGTDVGLWVTKQYRRLDTIIYAGRVPEMLEIIKTDTHLDIGGAVSLTKALPAIVEQYPGLDELRRRFASPPIRNAGTLGGNIANGSPIGDTMPALMVLGASLLLRKGENEREIDLSSFYHDYQVNDLQPGEFIARIRIPLVEKAVIVGSHKWSKRFDQDISAVCTAYRLERRGDEVTNFRMACGGLAPTVKRASHCEKALFGAAWSEAAIEDACDALAQDFEPISDMRASADMRLLAAQNLLRRFYLETTGEAPATVYNYGR
ncbi:MAG: xanthine dehydrogenase small subunit [Woeseiaceae bacterium]